MLLDLEDELPHMERAMPSSFDRMINAAHDSPWLLGEDSRNLSGDTSANLKREMAFDIIRNCFTTYGKNRRRTAIPYYLSVITL